MSFYDLDQKYLLTPKLLYFCVGSVYYAFYIFRIKFCHDYYGFKADKASDISAVISLFGFLFMAVWSWLADHLHRHRAILIVLAVAASGSFELLLLKVGDSYWYSLGIFAVFGAVLGGLLPLADYQILKLLTVKFKANKALYGRQRMMGTVSYGLTTLLVGDLIHRTNVTVMFYALPVFSTILVLVLLAFGFPDAKPEDDQLDKIERPQVQKPSFLVFFKDPHFIFFLLVVLVTGCGRQVLQIYLPPHLDKFMHMDERQAGYAVVSSTIFSIVFMFVGGSLIKYLGVHLMLVLGMAVMGLRLGAYMYLTPSSSPFLVYAIELLNGVAFSFTHLAGVKITADFAPPGLEATGQAIYTSSYMQLPAVLVPLIGRNLFRARGGVVLFGMTAKVLLVCAPLVGVKYLIQGKLWNRP
ncbi:hypothetical protein PSACC_02535 [Paramicrosporidium saccamoebae]|uniref:Major facilitator superfamily (MFS) profile domain-containing protein n=1 Tax=Paramicrosporidium saccamoebae TaxID=1246581 RepID=A0A2H9TIQ9_9FUNG|nr:hypothetical protein PSACC_02535 [Paramicrosporidium saccamoebae]